MPRPRLSVISCDGCGVAGVALFIFALLTGCKTHDHDMTTACSTLADLCHSFDDGGVPEAAECHAIGHRGSSEQCEAVMDHCRETCRYYDPFAGSNPPLVTPERDSGSTEQDASESDASSDAPSGT